MHRTKSTLPTPVHYSSTTLASNQPRLVSKTLCQDRKLEEVRAYLVYPKNTWCTKLALCEDGDRLTFIGMKIKATPTHSHTFRQAKHDERGTQMNDHSARRLTIHTFEVL
jgi:hypothetical protein